MYVLVDCMCIKPLIDWYHWYHIRFCFSVSALSFLPDGRHRGVGSKAKAKTLGESKVKAALVGSTGQGHRPFVSRQKKQKVTSLKSLRLRKLLE